MVAKSVKISAAFVAMALAACGGGGGGTGFAGAGGVYGGPPPVNNPPPNAGNPPITQRVAGKPAFVNPKSHHTLYILSTDTPTGGKCTGGCLTVWLPMTPSQGSKGQNGFGIATRSDGTGKQWTYKSHPLYMYAGDSGPDESNGQGIPFAGGHWYVARPKG